MAIVLNKSMSQTIPFLSYDELQTAQMKALSRDNMLQREDNTEHWWDRTSDMESGLLSESSALALS